MKLHPRRVLNTVESVANKVLIIMCIISIIVCTVVVIENCSYASELEDGTNKDSRMLEGNIADIVKTVKALGLQFNAEPVPTVEPQLSDIEIAQQNAGNYNIETPHSLLTKQSLPSAYYDNIDFSSFQAWMPYTAVTTKGSDSYRFLHNGMMYIDENGLCRYPADPETQFTVNGLDDYIVALGTFYKTRHKCGERFLVITTTGAFTIITGDEQADRDTDSHNMFIPKGNNKGSLIEYLVKPPQLHSSIRRSGNVTQGPVAAIKGKILHIYRINDK